MLILTDILKGYYFFHTLISYSINHEAFTQVFLNDNGDMSNLDYVSSTVPQTLFKEDDPSELSQVIDAL